MHQKVEKNGGTTRNPVGSESEPEKRVSNRFSSGVGRNAGRGSANLRAIKKKRGRGDPARPIDRPPS